MNCCESRDTRCSVDICELARRGWRRGGLVSDRGEIAGAGLVVVVLKRVKAWLISASSPAAHDSAIEVGRQAADDYG